MLVAETFIPNPDGKPEVNHDDGNKFNCHISNLYWATRAENEQHAVRTGLNVAAQGIDDFNSKIKDEADIIYIRDNPDNLTGKDLAAMFGVKKSTISRIQHGKTYTNTGGTIGKKRKPDHSNHYIHDEIRAQIRADRATGQYSKIALARKFGYCRTTIRKIINESPK